ncbi:hypothetical protein NPIL_159111 [Nephila pilipes]|uniref:Uncharacterized protein n=1 Tax=Nephila pilipes TaxID=299642 RepID=A0A8X6NH62_NEPPI|nr:hypothetical protein NPIL_159111 [Nephila pilipes]
MFEKVDGEGANVQGNFEHSPELVLREWAFLGEEKEWSVLIKAGDIPGSGHFSLFASRLSGIRAINPGFGSRNRNSRNASRII